MEVVRINDSNSINSLNSLLSGEISAVETYRQAIDHVQDTAIRLQLEECELSHRQRVHALRERIESLGAQPVGNSGIWGAFTRLMENGAAFFGDKAAVAVLEEGEDLGLREYKERLDSLDAGSRLLIQDALLPAQEHTRDAMTILKQTLH